MITDEIHATAKTNARRRGYVIAKWLEPAGDDLVVSARMRIKGRTHGLGFRWDGKKNKDLLDRVVSLDYAMSVLERKVAEGKIASLQETEQ
jgi:hypothetical protein